MEDCEKVESTKIQMQPQADKIQEVFMSNTIAHLTVANRILKECPTLVHDVEAFYLGCVAPDTIGSKDGYVREDKRFVHLREGIRDAEWLHDDKMQIFKNRIREFVNTYIIGTDESQRDFNIGYLVHLLTDEWNHRTIRQTMLKIANARNVLESDKEFFYMMMNDLEALDNYLFNNNEEISEIFIRLLNQDVQYDLTGYIEKEYIKRSIVWWKKSCLTNIKQRKLKYISEDDIGIFVEVAVKEIISELNTCYRLK